MRFLGSALWGNCPLAFAIAAPAAGGLANHIRQGASFFDYRYFILGVVAFVLAFFAGPYLLFIPTLRRLRIRGAVEYGTLSNTVGHSFEEKWIRGAGEESGSQALERTDFSATTDLYSITANVYEIRYVPLGSRAVLELIGATLTPFIPVLLFSVPIDTLLRGLKDILL